MTGIEMVFDSSIDAGPVRNPSPTLQSPWATSPGFGSPNKGTMDFSRRIFIEIAYAVGRTAHRTASRGIIS
jgi:hypothetical protein